MKIFKIVLLLLSTALLFSCNKKSSEATTAATTAKENTTVNAPRTSGQRGDRPRGNRGDRAGNAEAMYAALNLSEAQILKVKEIGEKYEARMRELRQSGSREGMREKMQSLRAKQNKEMEGVMTKDQFSKYIQMIEERRGQRGGGRGQRGGGGK